MKWLIPFLFLTTPALADCTPLSLTEDRILAAHGTWVEATLGQYHFLQGIYVMNPTTPSGLPIGDHAILVKLGTNSGAVIFFADGDMICGGMPVPQELLDLLDEVEMVKHMEGDL